MQIIDFKAKKAKLLYTQLFNWMESFSPDEIDIFASVCSDFLAKYATSYDIPKHEFLRVLADAYDKNNGVVQ